MADGSGGALGRIGLGLALAAGLVVSAVVVSNALVEIRADSQALEVKGFAERELDSDLATWTGSFTTRDAALTAAYATLERQRAQVLAYLESAGVPAADVELQPVTTQVLHAQNPQGGYTNKVEGYALTQQVKVRSRDMDLVGRVAKDSSALVRQGIEFSSYAPEYLYTKLEELKLEMLAGATADGRKRAETLAVESGSRLGRLLSARQGVFQITPAHSTEVSDYGQNDTSSRRKSIKAVVTVRYAVREGGL
jgi:hypothetical protein